LTVDTGGRNDVLSKFGGGGSSEGGGGGERKEDYKRPDKKPPRKDKQKKSPGCHTQRGKRSGTLSAARGKHKKKKGKFMHLSKLSKQGGGQGRLGGVTAGKGEGQGGEKKQSKLKKAAPNVAMKMRSRTGNSEKGAWCFSHKRPPRAKKGQGGKGSHSAAALVSTDGTLKKGQADPMERFRLGEGKGRERPTKKQNCPDGSSAEGSI